MEYINSPAARKARFDYEHAITDHDRYQALGALAKARAEDRGPIAEAVLDKIFRWDRELETA